MKSIYTFFVFLITVLCVQANTEILRFTVDDRITQNVHESHFLASNEQGKIDTASVLRPLFTQVQNSILPGIEVQLYKLENLKEGSSYEIRISYPATTPADFTINMAQQWRKGTDTGTIEGILEVTAVYTGVSLLKDMDRQPVTYDIVLERLYLGFLFYQAYKIVIAIVAMVLVAYFVFIPFVRQYLARQFKQIEQPGTMKCQ